MAPVTRVQPAVPLTRAPTRGLPAAIRTPASASKVAAPTPAASAELEPLFWRSVGLISSPAKVSAGSTIQPERRSSTTDAKGAAVSPVSAPRRVTPKAMTTVATKRAATAARWRLNTARKLLALPNFLRVLARAVLVVLVGFVAVGCSSDDASPGPTGAPAAVVAKAPDITLETI